MSPRESYSDQQTCLLQGSEAVRQAAEAARAFGEGLQLAADEQARLCLVVEELIANLYDHGGLPDQDQVELTLANEDDGIRVIIVDPGVPFDPRSVPPNYIMPERGGGAGLNIVRSWARFVDYQVTPGGNRLELILPLAR
jgi:anti-sigma regulatory factor (Ser/Thr protein kinase)